MKIKTNEICLYGILGILMFALKFAMSSLPNVEPVSLLLIAYTIVFGLRSIYPMAIYVLFEILIYGFSIWSIGYLYIWAILVGMSFIAFKISKNTNSIVWATISGIFGLMFGALYIPLYLITGGSTFAVSWWVSGIPYDIIHGTTNFILCLVLFKPTVNTLFNLKNIYFN